MKPYAEFGNIKIFHGRHEDVAPHLVGEGFKADMILTDPPYSAGVHKHALGVSGNKRKRTFQAKKLVDFDSIGFDELRAQIELLRPVAKGWLLATMDHRHAFPLETSCPTGWRFIRHGIWAKVQHAPQISGDRPAMGWEPIVCLHVDGKGRMKWNGGGKSLVLRHGSVQKTLYPTEKPLSLWRELVSLFMPKDGVLLDPYMGSGTSLVVAKERGLTAVGVDISEKACEVAATRLHNAERQGRMFG